MVSEKEKQIKEGVGKLTAKILLDSFKTKPKLEQKLEVSDELKRLQSGDLSLSSVKGLAEFIKSLEPTEHILRAVRDYLGNDYAKKAKEYIESEDYSSFINSLLQNNSNSKLNPFCKDSNDVAKSLVGTPITLIKSPGSLESGLITEVGAFSGEGYTEEFKLPKAEPGMLGVWRSPRMGGYEVGCISAHLGGDSGYVGIWGVTIGNEKLSMGKIPSRFMLNDLEGISLINISCKLKITPHDPTLREITKNTKVQDSEQKGKNCVGAYKLIEF